MQICFPLETEIAHAIFNDAIKLIKEGKSFRTGIKYPNIIGGDLLVQFIEARESRRTVLRMIFPNREGTYEGEIYTAQFEVGCD